MPNYQNGKIYRIECNITGETYYGSTTNKYLSNRKSQHKADVKGYDEGNRGKTKSYDIIKRGNWSIVLVEKCPCESKDELYARESFYIHNNECINKTDPSNNWTKEKDKEFKKKWFQRNKERIRQKVQERRANRTEEELAKDKQYNKERYENNKEEYSAKNKERREGEKREEILAKKREYHHNNKEKVAEKAKVYRENNKEVIREKKKLEYEKNKDKLNEVLICMCGCEVKRRNTARHIKTEKHKQLMEAQN